MWTSLEIVTPGLISYRILLCRIYIYISHATVSFTSVWLSTIPAACDICTVQVIKIRILSNLTKGAMNKIYLFTVFFVRFDKKRRGNVRSACQSCGPGLGSMVRLPIHIPSPTARLVHQRQFI
jgi:hypothetical protein